MGDPVSDERQNVVVNNGPADREFTDDIDESSTVVNRNAVDVQRLERTLNDGIFKEMCNVV